MVGRRDVVWAPDPFKSGEGDSGSSNPRPWLVVATDRLPYPEEESIAVALTTQTHHPGSLPIPGDAWVQGEPPTTSHVLPWSVATLKTELHVVGRQGSVTRDFADRVATETIAYLDHPSRHS